MRLRRDFARDEQRGDTAKKQGFPKRIKLNGNHVAEKLAAKPESEFPTAKVVCIQWHRAG
jgi:hypothetical protein